MTVDEAVAVFMSDAEQPTWRLYAAGVVLAAAVHEHKRTQATGGPPPPETRGWGNEQHVPPPESAGRADMAPPARYGASNQKRSKP